MDTRLRGYDGKRFVGMTEKGRPEKVLLLKLLEEAQIVFKK